MDIMQLKYFYALAQTQHMTRTAEQIHIAQPSLTQSMHRLEDELQVKLFRQSGRNIMLTECGRYLQQKIEPILAALNEIPEEIRAIAGERQHLLKINVPLFDPHLRPPPVGLPQQQRQIVPPVIVWLLRLSQIRQPQLPNLQQN